MRGTRRWPRARYPVAVRVLDNRASPVTRGMLLCSGFSWRRPVAPEQRRRARQQRHAFSASIWALSAWRARREKRLFTATSSACRSAGSHSIGGCAGAFGLQEGGARSTTAFRKRRGGVNASLRLEILEKRPEVLVPGVSVEWKAPEATEAKFAPVCEAVARGGTHHRRTCRVFSTAISVIRQGRKDVNRLLLCPGPNRSCQRVILFRWIYPGQALIVAATLALPPYFLIRGWLANRLARLRISPNNKRHADGSTY